MLKNTVDVYFSNSPFSCSTQHIKQNGLKSFCSKLTYSKYHYLFLLAL